MKAFDPNYKLLDEMYQDDYYPAFLVDRLFKCPHCQDCKGYNHKEKQKYHRTFPQGNDNDHGNIQDKEKQGPENLVQKLRNIFHVSHDL